LKRIINGNELMDSGNKKNIMNNILQIENLASGYYTLCIVNFEIGKQG